MPADHARLLSYSPHTSTVVVSTFSGGVPSSAVLSGELEGGGGGPTTTRIRARLNGCLNRSGGPRGHKTPLEQVLMQRPAVLDNHIPASDTQIQLPGSVQAVPGSPTAAAMVKRAAQRARSVMPASFAMAPPAPPAPSAFVCPPPCVCTFYRPNRGRSWMAPALVHPCNCE